MKQRKLFAIVAILMASFTGLCAQEADSLKLLFDQQQARLNAVEQADLARNEENRLNKIWKQRKHLTIGIGSQTLNNLDDKAAPATKSTSSFSLQFGKTFSLHKKPIANMLKIGLDWNSVDFHFAKYKTTPRVSWDYDDDDDWDDGWDDDDWDDDDFSWGGLGLSNLGYYQIDYGMAIGPSVQIAPLYSVGKGFEYLKAYTYFHVIPSFSGLLLSDDDETSFGYGYVTNFSWGIGISYRFISVGFETRWGSGKYDTSAFNDDIDEDNFGGFGDIIQSGDKTKYKTTSSRFTIGLRF